MAWVISQLNGYSRGVTYAEYSTARRFPALDGMRAVAAVLVVFFHFGGPDALQGWVGVQMFFVLSGFLITTLMLREERDTGSVSLRDFYLRRAFRILPVYYVVLAVTVLGNMLTGIFESSGLRNAVLYDLFFLNEFVSGHNPYQHTWTLGIEQKFYLVWPLLLIVAGTIRWRVGVAGFAIAAAAAAMTVTVSHPNAGWPMHYVAILMGCVLALALHSPRGFAVLRPLTSAAAGVPIAIGFILLHVNLPSICAFLHARTGLPGTSVVIPVYGLGMALLLVALLGNSPITRLLSCAPMRFLGERSYSLYLVQIAAGTLIWELSPSLSGMWRALAVTTLGVLLADLLYRTVEKPMITLGRRVIRSHRPEPTAERPVDPLVRAAG